MAEKIEIKRGKDTFRCSEQNLEVYESRGWKRTEPKKKKKKIER